MNRSKRQVAPMVAGAVAVVVACIAATPVPTTAAPLPRSEEDVAERSIRPTVEVLAISDTVTVTREGAWTNYSYTQPLENAEVLTYLGTPDADGDGCVFSGQETASAVDRIGGVIHEREVSTDVDSCVMVTERGIDPSILPDDERPESKDQARATEWASSPDGASASDSTMALLASYSAWHKTYYEDPPGLNVNSAKTFVNWVGNGSCVTSSSNHRTEYGWLQATGWRKDYSSTDSGRTCGGAVTESYSGFSNQPFCLPIAETRTNYRPNLIRGKANGVFQMEWSAHKEGDCASLLSFHRSHS